MMMSMTTSPAWLHGEWEKEDEEAVERNGDEGCRTYGGEMTETDATLALDSVNT